MLPLLDNPLMSQAVTASSIWFCSRLLIIRRYDKSKATPTVDGRNPARPQPSELQYFGGSWMVRDFLHPP